MTWASAVLRWGRRPSSRDGPSVSRVVLVTGGAGASASPAPRASRRSGAPGRGHLPHRRLRRRRRPPRRAVRRHRPRARSTPPSPRSRTSWARSRCSSSNAGITDDRLVLRMSDDDFTSVLDANLTGALPRRPARRADDDAGPLGPHHLRLLGRRRSPARPVRPTTPPRRPAWSAWPGRWPASSRREHHRQRRRPRTDRHRHDSTRSSDDRQAALLDAVPARPLRHARRGRRGRRLPGLRRSRLHHRRRAPGRRRPGHGRTDARQSRTAAAAGSTRNPSDQHLSDTRREQR